MNKFEDNKFYVMSPPGESWIDFDGPFDSQDEAVAYLKLFINEKHTHSPEMLNMVVVHFKDKTLDLVKVNDHPLNGEYLFWRL